MQKTVEQAEAIARAAFDAVEEMRWMDVVALIHPVALERFRQTRLYNEKQMEESKASRPRREGMPEEVVKWFEQQDAAVDYSPEEHRSRMYGVRTIEELEALSTDELVSRFLAAGDPRTHLRRQIIEQAGADDSELDGRQLGGERFEIVGSVVENPDTIHVLYRTTMSTSAPEQGNLDVASVMHMPDGWRLWPRREERRLFGGFTTGCSSYRSKTCDASVKRRLRLRPSGPPSAASGGVLA
ncbi:MAG: hypothetical protein ACREM1_19980 [Longimicrobiales bacterium]